MDIKSFKAGDKDTLLVISNKYYNWKEFLGENYVIPLKKGIPDIASRLVTTAAYQNSNGKKASKKQLEPHIDELIEYVNTNEIKTILCVDSVYFNYLTKQKFEESLGRAFKSHIPELEDVLIVPLLNAAVLYQNPAKKPMLDVSIQASILAISGQYEDKLFEFESFEIVYEPIRTKELLKEYFSLPRIAYDIETTGLDYKSNEFITHGFAKDRYNAFVIVSHEKL